LLQQSLFQTVVLVRQRLLLTALCSVTALLHSVLRLLELQAKFFYPVVQVLLLRSVISTVEHTNK
jgi:hypothetical protein